MITVWLNYGTEGWSPTDYDTAEAAIEAIQKGNTHGNEFRVTADIRLTLDARPRLEISN